MLIIRFKLLWIVVALIGSYLIVNDTYAYTSPSNNWYQINPNEIYCPPGPTQTDCNAVLEVVKDFSTIYILGPAGDPNVGQSVQVTGWVFSGDTYFINFTPDLTQVSSGTYAGVSFSDVDPNGNQTWGNGGIWGSANTTESVREDLVASVQATGANLWPMLIFLGVVLAFAIFGYLLTSVNTSVKPKNARRASKTFDPVQFNRKADELMEFYSKTGGTDPELVKQIKKNIK